MLGFGAVGKSGHDRLHGAGELGGAGERGENAEGGGIRRGER